MHGKGNIGDSYRMGNTLCEIPTIKNVKAGMFMREGGELFIRNIIISPINRIPAELLK